MSNIRGEIIISSSGDVNVGKVSKGLKVIVKKEDYWSIESFFYSAHYVPPYGMADILTSEFGGMYNASAGCRLVKDVQEYSNSYGLHYNLSLHSYLQGFQAQNIFRISNLILMHYEEMKRWELKIPRYMLITPNTSGQDSLRNPDPLHKEEITFPSFSAHAETSPECRALAMISYHILVNAATNSRDDMTYIKITLEVWVKELTEYVYGDVKDLIEAYERATRRYGIINVTCERVAKATINSLRVISGCRFNNDLFYTGYFIDIETDKDKFRELVHIFRKYSDLFLTARLFDLIYTHDIDSETVLSSGEQAMLDLYSRLYDAIFVKPSKLKIT